ncbi:MAG TPA: putative sugar nucleotidyl transferase [Pirellulaceae bacterium]|nr:putative sugar nucleotidyl transferase [Pirellulaceae bacterium]
MNILVFEDAEVTRLYPITTGRPAFATLCASMRLIDWLRLHRSNLVPIVRPHLRNLVTADFSDLASEMDYRHAMTLVVNARMVPSASNMERLRAFMDGGTIGHVNCGQSIAAAWLPTEMLKELKGFSVGSKTVQMIEAQARSTPETSISLELFDYPHDFIRANEVAFAENIHWRLQGGEYRTIADGVYAKGEVSISDFVVTNTERGPIVMEDDVAIGPFCYLRGPLHIGAHARINEHAAIKDCVSLGHTTKIGGEVECSVIDSYTNKQHHGFLGHSYLGSWINLGAGTCNSDLKNTYGKVKMEYGHQQVSTDLQFVGCIIGDYAKTAINTSIFTGKVIGVCSMIYGFVTTNVPSFVNYARSFGQVTESPPQVLEATQLRMFLRRNVQQRPVDIQLLHDMFELTRHDRQISNERLML